MLELRDWGVGGDSRWDIVSHDLLHDDSLGLLLLGLVSSHEVLEERESTWGVSRLDISVEVSVHLSEHLEVAEGDGVLLEEEEMPSERNVDDKHHWAEVVVLIVVVVSAAVVLTLLVVAVVAALRVILVLSLVPKLVTEHSVGLSSAIPLWFLGIGSEMLGVLEELLSFWVKLHWWHWWRWIEGTFWSIIHHLVHEAIKLAEVWILKIKMEFLTIDVGIEHEVGVLLTHW